MSAVDNRVKLLGRLLARRCGADTPTSVRRETKALLPLGEVDDGESSSFGDTSELIG